MFFSQFVIPAMKRYAMIVHDSEAVNLVVQTAALGFRVHLVSVCLHHAAIMKRKSTAEGRTRSICPRLLPWKMSEIGFIGATLTVCHSVNFC
jgi:hypothetical protein